MKSEGGSGSGRGGGNKMGNGVKRSLPAPILTRPKTEPRYLTLPNPPHSQFTCTNLNSNPRIPFHPKSRGVTFIHPVSVGPFNSFSIPRSSTPTVRTDTSTPSLSDYDGVMPGSIINRHDLEDSLLQGEELSEGGGGCGAGGGGTRGDRIGGIGGKNMSDGVKRSLPTPILNRPKSEPKYLTLPNLHSSNPDLSKSPIDECAESIIQDSKSSDSKDHQNKT